VKYTFLLIVAFASIIIYSTVKYPAGIVGLTKLNGDGCICHSLEKDSTVTVWITGPGTLQTGQSAIYSIHLTGGPKVKGGYNVTSRFGSLAAIDSFSKIIDAELTHNFPRSFNSNDTISWNFKYTSSTTSGTDTIYSVAQSVNGDEIPTDLDRWNFGNNFVVTVVPPVKVEDETELASMGFDLKQNYPNPFNPSTKIRYAIPLLGGARGGFVTLKVYNLLGNEVVTLLNEYKPAGNYEVEFSARGRQAVGSQQMANGIYYYKLTVGNYSETKKMLLLR
jgi:hypothetical protein